MSYRDNKSVHGLLRWSVVSHEVPKEIAISLVLLLQMSKKWIRLVSETPVVSLRQATSLKEASPAQKVSLKI